LGEDLAEDSGLGLPHPCGGHGRKIIEAVQMEQSMNRVKGQLLLDWVAVTSGVGLRSVGADNDFAMIKSNDVSRSFDTHEIDVDLRNNGIADDGNDNFGQVPQSVTVVVGEVLTDGEGRSRRAPEPDGVQANAPLAIDQDKASHAVERG
jgi:hypothetical protein